MGRRASIILPKRFRRGFRGATGGGTPPGGGGTFTTLGPNAPSGLTSPFLDFLGDTLPGMATTYGALNPNIYGWASVWDDGRGYSLAPDAESPSGQALRLNFHKWDHPRAGVVWTPPSGMGGAPCTGYINSKIYDVAAGRRWKRLYIHMWQRFSANFSVECRQCTPITHYSGTFSAGSTVTHLVDLTKAWTPGELVGKFLKHGLSGHGAQIIANDATTFDIVATDRLTSGVVGASYIVFTWDPTAVMGASQGCKGWFWPRMGGRLVGPVAGRGDGAVLGAWNAPKDFEGRLSSNHYHACWDGPLGIPGAPSDILGTQQLKTWEAPWTEDANDLPVWVTTGRNQYFPPRAAVTYTAGNLRKMEYYLQLPTPGHPDGIWRAWQDGVLVKEATNVFATEQYYSALEVEASAGVARPVIGGASRDAAYECLDTYVQFLWNSMTGGGAPGTNYLPENEMWTQCLACAISGSNSRT